MLKLEVKPPKVSLMKLIEAKMIKINEVLYNKNGDKICNLLEDGKVTDGEDILSIHKMSAKYLKQTNHNGWDYFYYKKGEKLISIDNLRYEFSNMEVK